MRCGNSRCPQPREFMRELSFFVSEELFVAKEFYTYQQQLDKLEKEKDLLIQDRVYAENKLKEISYYSLIGGYKQPFKHLPSGKYLRGVTFEEIVNLYYFDEEMRSLFLKYILHVERQIKSLLSYHFCEKYGNNQIQYLNANNYNNTPNNTLGVNKLVNCLQNAITLPSNYPYIVHHVKNYGNVPLWVAMNAITFGNVAAMYQYVTTDVRAKVSQNYEKVSEAELHQFIRIIASCRNVCAHGERLYTFHSKLSGPDTDVHKKMGIARKKGAYVNGKHDLFAVVIALKYLIPDDEFKEFKRKLIALIDKVNKGCPHLTQKDLFNYMGFPSNWEKITRYKK
jgi:abortive infection bacteriophage resistance protein